MYLTLYVKFKYYVLYVQLFTVSGIAIVIYAIGTNLVPEAVASSLTFL